MDIKEEIFGYENFGIERPVFSFGERVEEALFERFKSIEKIAEINSLKVLHSLQKNRVSTECFSMSTGYGYNDYGRDTLEKVYRDYFSEFLDPDNEKYDALVRPQITCGTHALALALLSNLRPGDELFSPVGQPYDTLLDVIGINPTKGSLMEYGISYAESPLIDGRYFDFDDIKKKLNDRTALVTIQRSRGYGARKTLTVDEIGELISFIRGIKPDVRIMIDNCYGEFTELHEPLFVGADLLVGSLIKNPGGGLAPVGGYLVGRKDMIENAAFRLTSPGLGKEVGASLDMTRPFMQGFFLAPEITKNAMKTAVFAGECFSRLGFTVSPANDEKRSDIIESIDLKSPDALIAFCEGIQAAAPVDSFVVPEPSYMPGYADDVIMAAGAFVQGSSIELSADGPLREPFRVFLQGGLTWPSGRLGVLMALQKMYERNLYDKSLLC